MKSPGRIIVGFLVLPFILALGYLYARSEPARPQFYRDIEKDLDWDVWGFPIIEPHYLMTTFSVPKPDETRWIFSEKNSTNNFSPDSISYQNNFILFHAPYKNEYGFYDLRLDKTVFLGSIQKFRTFTQAKVISGELYEVEAVYKCWHETGQLPWGKDIFIQNYGSITHK